MGLDRRYQEIFSQQRQYSIRFLENHCSSLASLLVINRRFGEKKIIDDEADSKYFLMIDSCLSPIYPGNKHLVEHKRKIEVFSEQRKMEEMTEKRMASGNKAPDITLQNTAGKDVRLYSLQGKPILIYFWASWDKESRKSNRIVRDLLNNAGKGKPRVYAIGLESYKEVWEDAIRADGLEDWTNVTDFLNVSSAAKTMFNVPDKFPYFILLDPGLIIRYRGNSFDDLSSEINKLVQ
jgi:hypothetical protein